MTDDFPPATPARPLWLVTLADLALLLLGFLVLIQATRQDARGALASALRSRFGGEAQAAPAPLPVEANAVSGFAPGSAALPAAPDALVAWAREAVRDPRVALTVSAATDGSAADVDPATGSAALLAADRARAVAAALATAVPADRLTLTTAPRARRRAVLVTLAFAGEAKETRR